MFWKAPAREAPTSACSSSMTTYQAVIELARATTYLANISQQSSYLRAGGQRHYACKNLSQSNRICSKWKQNPMRPDSAHIPACSTQNVCARVS